jgi:hypothetical protein
MPAVEPFSLADGKFARFFKPDILSRRSQAVLVPITRWATKEMTANNSNK